MPPPVMLSAPQTVFSGVSGLATATVTINNFPSEAVSVWLDNSSGLLLSAPLEADWPELTLAICPSGNSGLSQADTCFGTIPSRFAPPDGDLELIWSTTASDVSSVLHVGDATLTFWFNPALTLDAPSGTHLVWAPSASCASGAASCFVASSDLRATGASSSAVPVSFSGDTGSLLGSSAAVAAFTADAGCAAADLVGGAGCSIVVPAALASASAVGFESATQDAAAVTASVSHASVTWSVRPPIRLTSPQTVFTGVSLSSLVTTTVTISNFPASAPVSVWVDGLGISDLLIGATADFAALTTAICPTTLTSNHFNGSANACSGVLPSRFAPPNDLNLAFNPQANDRAATLHIGEASITFSFNPAVQLDVSPTDITWVAGGAVTAQSVTLTVTHPPSGAVTMRVLGAVMDASAAVPILLLDACEAGARGSDNAIYNTTPSGGSGFERCVAEVPSGIGDSGFRFVSSNPTARMVTISIDTAAVTISIHEP